VPKAGHRLKHQSEDPKSYVFKDKDLDRTFWLDPISHDYLFQVLREDTAFLSTYNCMDYSLLLGIHRILPEELLVFNSLGQSLGDLPQPLSVSSAVVEGSPSVTTDELEKVFEKKRDQKIEEKREQIAKRARSRKSKKRLDETDVHFAARLVRRQQEKIAKLAKLKEKQELKFLKKQKSEQEIKDKSSRTETSASEAEEKTRMSSSLNDLGEAQDDYNENEPTFTFKDPLRSADVPVRDGSSAPGEPDMNELYFVSIIDYLSRYTLKKKAAHFVKRFLWPSNQLSTIPSSQYAQRFTDFMSTVFKPVQAKQV